MFTRHLQHTLTTRLSQFPVVALVGPRQSGKTTLLKTLCPDHRYLNLESPEQLERIKADPKGVLKAHMASGLILDEAQRYPEIFSYIQVIADEHPQPGRFIVSGSQNFLLNQHITQSLAGRVAILELLPLSLPEYNTHHDMPALSLWEWLYKGGYPRPHQEHIPAAIWLDSYVKTYLERDVRDLLKVKDLMVFQKFLRMCAARHGQLLNMQQLSIDCGVSHTTIREWLSVLEASYLIHQLPPYHTNFHKRLVKSPKLYFYDTGLVCYLLGIDSADHLSVHGMRGAIFEGYVINEIKKHFVHEGITQPLYFWRDSNGIEIDCMLEYKGQRIAIEIKSTGTFRLDLLKQLKKMATITDLHASHLIYAGDEPSTTQDINVTPWHTIDQLFNPTPTPQ